MKKPKEKRHFQQPAHRIQAKRDKRNRKIRMYLIVGASIVAAIIFFYLNYLADQLNTKLNGV